MAMAPQLLLLLITTLLATRSFCNLSIKASKMYPLTCSQYPNKTCDAYLYHISTGLKVEDIAFYYSVNPSQINPIRHGTKTDYLISVPCSCQDVNGTTGFFYHTSYSVRAGDTFAQIQDEIYSWQAWSNDGQRYLFAGEVIPIHLLCGCWGGTSKVITYTVQEGDSLNSIVNQLSSNLSEIQSLNVKMTQNLSYIDVDWVLFVPTEKVVFPAANEGKRWKKPAIIAIIISLAFLMAGVIILIVYIRNRSRRRNTIEDPKVVAKSLAAKNIASLQNQYLKKESIEDVTCFESERPLIFSLEEIEETLNSYETRKIGEGGFANVYFGMLRKQEVAIKKMKSSKSKEFFAELKVLCKLHHRNVVELIGYASGDDHLYLVYEYVQNGSLSDHLHCPLLKGHQPLSWNARTQIALDTARGIEYIHDHTKARYVHRDIKTSNILLDQGLKAKVADFGLAKLIERSNEKDCVATCLVGTPGYLPPESVHDLKMTSKTDVFAFGVVLAELITGQRALIRDNGEPNKMKSLASVVDTIFQEEETGNAIESFIDGSLKGHYPMEEAYKMAEIAAQCLSKDAVNRPEMREIVIKLSQIMMSSIEWEASLGGNSQVFSGIYTGR